MKTQKTKHNFFDKKKEDLIDLLISYESSIVDLKSQLLAKNSLVIYQEAQINVMREKLKLSYARKYARTSERYEDNGQMGFFDEPKEENTTKENMPDSPKEEETSDPSQEKAENDSPKETTDSAKSSTTKTKKTGRKKLPNYLPREDLICELPESELITEDGYKFTKMDEEVTEYLEIIPATVKVIRVIRFKYSCKDREEYGIKIAPNLSNQVIPKSMVGNGMIAHMLVQKFCYHMPFYRQEQIWQNLEVEISRATMCNWAYKISSLLLPMMNVLKKEIFSSGYIHADETPVTVLETKNYEKDAPPKLNDEKIKKASKCYMWIYGNSLNGLVMYDYQQTRSGVHAYNFLKDFKGYIQADAYAGYDQVYNQDRIEVGCMAHARRKFMDILKVDKKHKHASYAIKEIQALYKIERELKELDNSEEIGFDKIKELRLERSKGILLNLFKWMEDLILKTPPKGSLGNALNYCIKNKAALSRYLDEGYLSIDNNFAENAIRPFTLGRKNWLFCGNHEGAKGSATIYSLIESAKSYKLKPYEYLKYLLDNVKPEMSESELAAFLPHRIKIPTLLKAK